MVENTFLNDNPSPQPLNSGVEVDNLKAIKTDRIDRQISQTQWVARFTLTSIVGGVAGLTRYGLETLGRSASREFVDQNQWLVPVYESVNDYSIGLNATEAGVILIPVVYATFKSFTDKRNLYREDTLNVTAEPLVYKSKKPLEVGNFTLRKKDNVIYACLPHPEEGIELTPEATQLYGNAVRLAVEDIRKRFAGHDYKAIAIDSRSFTANTSLDSASRISNAQILQGKDINSSAGELIIIPTEDLDKLQFNTTDQLRAALDRLNDPNLEQYFALVQRASSQAEIEKIQLIIKTYLKSKLTAHALAHFAESQVKKITEPPLIYKKKIYETVQLLTDRQGQLIIQRGTTDDGFSKRELHQSLGVERDVKVQDLDPNSVHYRGQLLYIVHELLRTNSITDLIQQQETDPQVVAEKLAKLGFPIAKSTDALHNVADNKVRLDLIKQIERSLIPLMIAGIIYAATPTGVRIARNIDFSNLPGILNMVPKNTQQAIIDASKPSDFSVRSRHRSSVYGLLPPRTVDWLILNEGDIPMIGYYTLETSHRIENGEWVINQDRARVLEVPKPPYETESSIKINDKNYLHLTQRLDLPFTPTYRFKLPVREGTQLSYLDMSLENATYKVYELTDGTIEIEINHKDMLDFNPVIEIDAYFTKVITPTIKAKTSITPIDSKKLDQDNLQKIEDIKSNAPRGGFVTSIAEKVKGSHLYSLASRFQDRLHHQRSGEELVNIVASDEVCACDTCTAGAVLESTLGQTSDDFANIAFGYLNGVHALEGRENRYLSFLRGDTRHAYMIKNDGSIVDPTPSVSNGDELTEKYLDNIRRNSRGSEDHNTYFRRQSALIDKYFHGQKPGDYLKILRILGGFGLVSAAYLGFRFLNNTERRSIMAQRAKRTRRSLFLATLSDKDLDLANNFIPWLSFGEGLVMGQESFDLSKEEKYGRARRNYSAEAIDRYKADPSPLEVKAGIKGLDALKMRYLARFFEVI
jgi:hypothetical protein